MQDSRRCTIGFLIVLAVVLPFQTVAGQRLNCDPCIELTREVRLSSRFGAFTPSTTQSVLTTDEGRYLVSHMHVPPAIAVHDSAGSGIDVFDREGDGPGEFRRSPHLLAGPDGTVYGVYGDRLVRFDENLMALATVRMDFPVSGGMKVATLPSGALALNHREITNDEGVTYDVSILSMDGSLVTPVQPSDGSENDGSVVARSATGGLWTLPITGLRLREYATDGSVRSSVSIEASRWAAGGEQPRAGPRNTGLRDLGDGRLLLLTSVADPDPPEDEGGSGINLTTLDRNGRWDSVVHVLDARSGEVLARQRFDRVLRLVEGADDLLFSTQVAPLGHVETQVWRFEIAG